jgi:hypothetical protein
MAVKNGLMRQDIQKTPFEPDNNSEQQRSLWRIRRYILWEIADAQFADPGI